MSSQIVIDSATPTEAEEPTDTSDNQPQRAVAARQGVLILRDDGPRLPTEVVLAAVCDALKSDSRVKDFSRPVHREHASRRDIMYPRIDNTSADVALVGGDHFHSVRLSDPIVFEVSVPAANQGSFAGSRDFPEGNYFVAWDGVVLVVGWEQQSNERVSRAAGRVAIDVITEAAQKAGLSTYLQACSPGCGNGFLHTDALIIEEGSQPPANMFGVVVVELPSVPDTQKAVAEWYQQISYRGFLFAIFKNHARRIRDLDSLARGRVQQLLHLRQQRMAVAKADWRTRRQLRKPLKGWRKASRKHVADVWLAAASIEVGRGQWDEKRRRFKDNNAKAKIKGIFERDLKDDEVAVDGIDLSFARAALEYSAARFDAQVLTFVTGLAGMSGIIGGVVGATIGS